MGYDKILEFKYNCFTTFLSLNIYYIFFLFGREKGAGARSLVTIAESLPNPAGRWRMWRLEAVVS